MPTARPQHRGKLAVSYGWAGPVTRKRSAQSSRFQTLIKYFNLYCKHSTMMGLKYLVEDRATWTVRFLWAIAYGLILWLMWTFIPLINRDYFTSTVRHTPESNDFPTERIEFPGIAICSVNRISLGKATTLATDMFDANISNMTFKEILDAIHDLGHLYDNHVKNEKDYEQIIALLTMFYGHNYNITAIMKYLTPECSSLLITCVFHGNRRNCSDIFSVRRTQDGFCCTFNYYPEKQRHLELVKDVGLDYGLAVTLDPMSDDYFYSLMPTVGFKVMVFRPRHYPDTNSGGVTEVLLAPLTKGYLILTALGLTGSDSVRSYPVRTRNCVFGDENPTIYKLDSSSDCIVACKMEDIWKFCRCKPFFYPNLGLEKRFNRTCTLEDVPCIEKYRENRHSVVPYVKKALIHLLKENRTLYCGSCYPQCNDVSYKVRTHMYTSREQLDDDPEDDVKYSTLHVFFINGGTPFLKLDVTYKWYQYLSDFGGICDLFLGCSLISLVEIVYYAALCLSELLTLENDPEIIEEVKVRREQLPIQHIYWNELIPRCKTTKQLKRLRKVPKNLIILPHAYVTKLAP
ncbi:sodium channel protein Nach-like [Augochlora pura]